MYFLYFYTIILIAYSCSSLFWFYSIIFLVVFLTFKSIVIIIIKRYISLTLKFVSQKKNAFFIESKNEFIQRTGPCQLYIFSICRTNLWIPRQKIHFLSRQTTHQAILGRFRKNRSADLRAHGPSTKTGGKGPGMVTKRNGITPPTRVSPSSFRSLLTCTA